MITCRTESWLSGPASALWLGALGLVLVLVIVAVIVLLVRTRGRSPNGGPSAGAALGLVLLAGVVVGTLALGGAMSPASAVSPSTGDPACTTSAVIGADEEITFVSGDVTFAASYRGPVDTATPVPAVVIVVGTGGVDRNGDAPTLQTQAYEWLADVMSANGIASLRYDKLGTGATGLGPHAQDPDALLALSYDEARLQPIRDALSFVAAQPGVDPERILLLGHSEGGAGSLFVAANRKGAPELAGLLLIEPAYAPILDILTTQFTSQIDAAVAAGVMTAADADTLTAWMADGVSAIRSGTPPDAPPGEVPLPDATDVTALYQQTIASNIYGTDPAQMVVSHAYRTLYGKQFDELVPDALAPLIKIPTLITCGTKDFNTPCGDGTPSSGVLAVAAGLGDGLAKTVIIPDMVHILRDVGTSDVAQPADQVMFPFSLALESVIADYLVQFTSR